MADPNPDWSYGPSTQPYGGGSLSYGTGQCGPNIVDIPAGTVPRGQSVPTSSDVTTAGSIAAGAMAVTIANTSISVTATVNGSSLAPGQQMSWSAEESRSLSAIAYNPGVGGALKIIMVR